MGLSSSSDEWCRHSDRVVEGFPWCQKIVDNILISASTPSELEKRILEVVKRCEQLHVTLSRSKFQVDITLNFARCVLSATRMQLDPSRISALSNFPTPTDQTSVRSFLGLFVISLPFLCLIISIIRCLFASLLARAVHFSA